MTLHIKGLSAMRAGRTILHPTDLSLPAGGRIGLVGPSGSGKSTLCHALIDRLRAEGIAVAHVPQSPEEALDPLRRLDFHWRQAERALGLAPDPARQGAILRALGLEGRPLNVRPWGWSRGMQQRFVIALALLARPSLLILDEPTSALDPVIAAATLELVEAHAAETGTTLLIVTHDLGLAAARAHRLLVLHDGRIVEDAATGDLLARPESAPAQALVAHRNWAELPC
ncbi:ATP-binding cassette domain-containing protein [Psychromarinibacter sp. S121]|uniref:ATP-binding cassette domain-containing protein n=1 Tax=Psychromarinibacter sp. S121 TaxID=3415127 RepID=UPI003C7DE5A7